MSVRWARGRYGVVALALAACSQPTPALDPSPDVAFARRIAAIEQETQRGNFDWRAWRDDLAFIGQSAAYRCSMAPEAFEQSVFTRDDHTFEVACTAQGEADMAHRFSAVFKSCPTLMLIRGSYSDGRQIYSAGNPDDNGGRERRVAPACRERGPA